MIRRSGRRCPTLPADDAASVRTSQHERVRSLVPFTRAQPRLASYTSLSDGIYDSPRLSPLTCERSVFFARRAQEDLQCSIDKSRAVHCMAHQAQVSQAARLEAGGKDVDKRDGASCGVKLCVDGVFRARAEFALFIAGK